MKRSFTVVIERDLEGGYVASVPELPGCHTQGDNLRELRANVREAIALYLEDGDLPLKMKRDQAARVSRSATMVRV